MYQLALIKITVNGALEPVCCQELKVVPMLPIHNKDIYTLIHTDLCFLPGLPL